MYELQELNIIEILYNYQTKKNEKDVSDYLLTNCDSIKTISQAITDIIYDTRTNVNNETRKTIIKLLKHFTASCSHTADEFDNILVDILKNNGCTTLNTYSEKYQQDFLRSNLNIPRQFICDAVNKKYALLLAKSIQSGLINTWHQNYFIKLNFAYTVPNKLIQNHNLESLLLVLTSLNNKSCESLRVTGYKRNIDQNKCIVAPSKDFILFQLIFVLLDFKQTEENTKLLDNILVDIFVSRKGIDTRFVEYLWMSKENLQLPTSVYISLLKYFKYLYEKPLIRLVIDIIKEKGIENDEYEYEYIIEQSRVKNIVKICVLDVKLSSDLFLMFTKLLALTKYDMKIIKLFKCIKSIMNC